MSPPCDLKVTGALRCVESAGSNRRTPVRFASLAPVLLLVAALFGSGCDAHTCENACAQYYGTDEGQCSRPSVLTDGTLPEAARGNCVDDCRAAIYTTTGATGAGTDQGGYSRLENEQDAIEFIDCIVDKDFSAAVRNDTCEDLFFDCPWIRW